MGRERDIDSTPWVPDELRASIERFLYSDLERFEALLAAETIEALVANAKLKKSLPLPSNPVVSTDLSGQGVLIDGSTRPPDAEDWTPLPSDLVLHLDRAWEQLDVEGRGALRWFLGDLLRSQVIVLLLYKELMFGHLILRHRATTEQLLAMSEDGWYELHRNFGGSES